ncbi:MAG: ATPase [Phycisphaerae bacterium]|nr:ATPase [Phycisphaerae bacterium]
MTTTAATDSAEIHTLEIRRDIFVAASQAIAFEAVLEELGPGGVLPDGTPFPMKVEPWPGGRWYRDLDEMGGHKAGHLWGHVQVIKAPSLLELVGPMPMSFPAVNHVQYRLKPEAEGTRVSLVHTAMGLIPQDFRDGMPDGWEHGLSRVKLIAERKAAIK